MRTLTRLFPPVGPLVSLLLAHSPSPSPPAPITVKGRLACGDHFEDVAFPWAIHQKDAEGHTRVNYPNLKKNLRDCVPLRLMETVQKACGYHVPRDTYHTEYYKGVGESSSESSNWTDR